MCIARTNRPIGISSDLLITGCAKGSIEDKDPTDDKSKKGEPSSSNQGQSSAEGKSKEKESNAVVSEQSVDDQANKRAKTEETDTTPETRKEELKVLEESNAETRRYFRNCFGGVVVRDEVEKHFEEEAEFDAAVETDKKIGRKETTLDDLIEIAEFNSYESVWKGT